MLRLVRRLKSDDRGTSLIEAAIVVPIAAVLLIGVIDFGRAYYNLAVAQKSVRAAVRYLTSIPTSGLCPAAVGATPWGWTKSKNLAAYGNIDGTGKARVTFDTFTVTTTSCPVVAGNTVKVAATFTFKALAWQYLGFSKTQSMKVNYEAKWIGQ